MSREMSGTDVRSEKTAPESEPSATWTGDSSPLNGDHIVDWDGPNDTHNPRNWPGGKRWAHVIVVALLGLLTNMAPTMCAPGIDDIARDFHIESPAVSTLAITLYVLGIALGPMLMSPLSEVYGRLPIYHASNAIFVVFVIASALARSLPQFMVFRFLSGCAGGTPMALGGGTIADVTSLEQRASAMSLFSLGPLTGPVLGPLIGGFVAGAIGWRWTFWLLAILGGALAAATVVVMRETQPRVLLERKAKRLRASTGSQDLVSRLARTDSANQILVQALVRPMSLLFRSPILLVISLYVALVFGLLYILFTTFSPVFEGQYGFTTSTSGLVYLGLGIALVLDVLLFGAINSRVQARILKSHGLQRPLPEHRLVLMIFLSPFVAVGMFIYGWTVHYKVHWIVPIVGTTFVGFGAFFVVMPAQLYIVDLFGSEAAASALSANLLLRYVSGTFLPLAAPSMYKTLGYGWGNTLLGFLALAFIPAPILFYRYGERLRRNAATLA